MKLLVVLVFNLFIVCLAQSDSLNADNSGSQQNGPVPASPDASTSETSQVSENTDKTEPTSMPTNEKEKDKSNDVDSTAASDAGTDKRDVDKSLENKECHSMNKECDKSPDVNKREAEKDGAGNENNAEVANNNVKQVSESGAVPTSGSDAETKEARQVSGESDTQSDENCNTLTVVGHEDQVDTLEIKGYHGSEPKLIAQLRFPYPINLNQPSVDVSGSVTLMQALEVGSKYSISLKQNGQDLFIPEGGNTFDIIDFMRLICWQKEYCHLPLPKDITYKFDDINVEIADILKSAACGDLNLHVEVFGDQMETIDIDLTLKKA